MAALLPARPRRTISLTALIDVVFILLMFFMLTSSFTQWQFLDLQVAASEALVSNTPDPVWVLLDSAGTLQPQGEWQARSDWLTALGREIPLIVVPEAEVPVQQLVITLQQLRDQGFASVDLGKPRRR